MNEFVNQIHKHLPWLLRSLGLVAPLVHAAGPLSPFVGQLSLFAAVSMQPPLVLILEFFVPVFS